MAQPHGQPVAADDSTDRTRLSDVLGHAGFTVDELDDIDNLVPRFREQALAINALITNKLG